jgi:replication factor C subunit 2/4
MHKIIILDEADALTTAAQQALRMVMTEFSNTTRFALACNDSSKLIEPIQSRCAIVRFTKLSDNEVLRRLQHIIKQEDLHESQQGIDALIFTAEGDMRYALNNLQATAAGFDKQITKENVFKVCDQPHPDIIRNAVLHCLKGSFSAACREVDSIYDQGYNMIDIVQTLSRVIQNSDDIKHDTMRLAMLKEASIIKMRTLEGNNSQLQLHGFLSKLCTIGLQMNRS